MNLTNEIQALRSANAGLMKKVKRLEQDLEAYRAEQLDVFRTNSQLRNALSDLLAALNGASLTNAIQRAKDLL